MKLLFSTVLIFLLALAPAGSAEIKAEGRSFAAFWIQFQAAVVKGDKEAIAGMTRLPFYGKMAKADFMKECDELFPAEVRRCFRNAKPVKDDNGDSYSVFCGETIFIFEKANGEYKFTDLGVND
jgi:hypothetical protein